MNSVKFSAMKQFKSGKNNITNEHNTSMDWQDILHIDREYLKKIKPLTAKLIVEANC